MIAPPDAPSVRAFLARVSRRVAWIAGAQGAAMGFAVALVLLASGWATHDDDPFVRAIVTGLTLAAGGLSVGMLSSTNRRRRVAYAVEQRAPQCLNLLITADELLSSHGAARTPVAPGIVTLVARQAAQLTSSLDITALFPARNALAALTVSLMLWAAGIARFGSPGAYAAAQRTASIASATIDGVDVVVTPPAYVARSSQLSHDPARIEALAGSRVNVTVHAHAASIVAETLHGELRITTSAPATFTSEFLADADGYVALEPRTANGRAGARRLIGLSVTPDAPPRVRITNPGKDLFLRDTHRALDLAVESRDDLGLATLRLRYTKVSGSGERFTFTDGDVPLEITRADSRTWTARGRWNLESLGLSPGDMVVYRAVATDHRPGAPPTESDAFIAEILAAGGVAAPGFALDPDQERYAVSQQMVILKTERLVARKPTLSAEAATTESQELAAEQRKVRAEFVFMMGGELEDASDLADNLSDLNEEQEAEGESDLISGRMANQGRVALLNAIRRMSRATTALNTVSLTIALTHERAALKQLERAFSHTRIILRALTEHEQLDLTRRLSGVLSDARRDTRPVLETETDPRVIALRRSLAGIAILAGTPRLDVAQASSSSALAQSVLHVDPASLPLQGVAARLTQASDAIARTHFADARVLLDRGATELAAVLRAHFVDAPFNAPSLDAALLRGALTDAWRRPDRPE